MAGKRAVVPPPYGEAALFGSLESRAVCVAPGDLAWEDRQYELHVGGAVVHAPTMELPAERATVDAAELVARGTELLGHVVRLRGATELGTAVAFQSTMSGEVAFTNALVATVPGTDGRLFIASPRELTTDYSGGIVATSPPAGDRLVVVRRLASVVDPDREMETWGRKRTTARRVLEDAIGGPLPEDALAARELRPVEPSTAGTWIPLAGSSHRRWTRFPGALTAPPTDTACGEVFVLSATDLLRRDGPAPLLSMESRLFTRPDVPKRKLGRALLDALPYLLASVAALGGFAFLPRREPRAPDDRQPGSPYRS